MRSVLLLLLTALPPAVAQRDPAALVRQLHEDGGRLAALQGLHDLGARALPALLAEARACADREDEAGEARVLLAIGRLGPRGAPALAPLCDRLATAPTTMLAPLLRTIACIGSDQAGALAADFHATVQATETPTGRTRQEWGLACSRLQQQTVTTEILTGALQMRTLVAASSAAMWVADHPEVAAEVADAVRIAHHNARELHDMHGDSWQIMLEETARAVVVAAPDSGDAELAWACLCGYRDPVVRLSAVTALRRRPGSATEAIPALTQALADDERAVVREAMITLGFFGEEALGALPPLARLRDGNDRELARIARTTIDGIRRALTSIPAVVAGLIDATPADAEAVIARIVQQGPRAVPHLQTLADNADGNLREWCMAAIQAIAR